MSEDVDEEDADADAARAFEMISMSDGGGVRRRLLLFADISGGCYYS